MFQEVPMLYHPGQQLGGQYSGGGGAMGATHVDQIITNAAPLPFPLEAKLDATGETVTLLQTCDWKGQSRRISGSTSAGSNSSRRSTS
jgi:hypothetical protein